MICESRRQSNAAQRFDLDGTHSLHGSLTGHLHFRESSPFITRHRKLDNTPLYINNNEEGLNDEDLRKDGVNGNAEEQEQSKRQVAMVGPMIRSRNVLNSINSSSEEIGKSHAHCLQLNIFHMFYVFQQR